MSDEILWIVPVVFVASFARATLGFGDGLLAMPLLALALPPRVAAPLVAVTAATTAAFVLVRQWRQVRFRAATSLIAAAVLAIPVGVWFLNHGNERIAKLVLAVVVLGFAAWSLRGRHVLKLEHDRWSPVFGLVAGFLSGAFNTGGPPIVMYGTLRRWPPDQFRATLQSYTLVAATWVVAMHAAAGLMTRRVLTDYLCCLPAILLAVVVGPRLTRKLSTDAFIRIIFWSLLIIGSWLLITNIR